ncbi:MAG: glycosyltransferase family 39 protein [Bacteroidales bacterium]|nr:glycosyltransferase family 39 protein [Bacteroidales bacterium]
MLIKKYYFPKISGFVFISIFTVLFFIYNFDDILLMRPQSVHQWRQCDCLAFTQTYYKDKNAFFEPQVLYLGEDNTGKTATEFPIIYCTIAQLWKIFGKEEFVYRSFVLLLSFIGLFSLFKMSEDILKDSFLALWISFILFSSPMLVYYANNFLMNVPAFSIALVALYFFYLFYKKSKNKYLYISVILYTLAGLIKIPALSSFMAIIGLLIWEQLKIIKTDKKIFFDIKTQLPVLLFVFMIVGLWYVYAAYYNEQHTKGMFLIGILPIWMDGGTRIKHIIENIQTLWLDSYQSITIQIISIIMFLIVIVLKKYNNKYLWWMSIFLSLGFISFLFLWFDVFDNHDYYLINQLIFMISIFIAFFFTLKQFNLKLYNSAIFRFVLFIILLINIAHCKKIIELRYTGWPNKYHLKVTKSLETITPYLRSIGISYKDTVLFIQDPSLNISLYLMEQKGYTNFESKLKDSTFIREKIKSGAKYLLVNDSNYIKADYLKPFLVNKVGAYKNVTIYKINND